jgi:hypothetical protein
MTDAEMRDIFRSGAPEPGGEAPGGRVPWWGVILGFLAGLIALSATTAAVMAVLGDTFMSWSGGWPERAMNVLLIAMFVGGAALPVFAVVRAVMAWANCRYWIVFVAIWAVVTFGYVAVLITGGALFDAVGWRLWLVIGAGPSVLAGTLQYFVEPTFRRAP